MKTVAPNIKTPKFRAPAPKLYNFEEIRQREGIYQEQGGGEVFIISIVNDDKECSLLWFNAQTGNLTVPFTSSYLNLKFKEANKQVMFGVV